MTLEADHAEWVASRPDWQKDAIARFCGNESLSGDDIAAVADQLIAGTFPDPPGITAQEVPGTSESGESLRLLDVGRTGESPNMTTRGDMRDHTAQ